MRYLFLGMLLASGFCLSAQPEREQLLDWECGATSLEQAFYELSELTGVSISFSNSALPGTPVPANSFRQKRLEEILEVLLQGTGFNYQWVGKQILVLRRPDSPIRKFSISGYVRDAISGEPLVGANVYSELFGKGTTTNAYGYYSLTLVEGQVEIAFSYLGYKQQTLPVELFSNQVINRELRPSVTLEEVLVTAPSISASLQVPAPGRQTFRVEEMEDIPSLAGEPDLFRLTYLLPGVQTGADGYGGLSVRGGGVDQNLVLLDGVPVYNATHMLGIFSVFNNSAIRSVQLIKGVFPARYGGRVSSVVDVHTKEGNNKEWIAEGDVGIALGKVSVEGPLVAGKSSVFLGARRSFIDFYSRPITRQIWEDRGGKGEVGYYFYDINAKINYRLGYRDHLYASFYTGGDDYFNDQELVTTQVDSATTGTAKQEVRWGNAIGSLRWNHLFSDKLFSNTTLTYSRFFYGSRDIYNRETNFNGQLFNKDYLYFRYNSNNRDLAFSTDFDFRPHPDHTVRFGGNAVLHRFQPGAVSFDESVQSDTINEETIQLMLERTAQLSEEYSLYVEDEFMIKSGFGGNVGFRATGLHVNGELLAFFQPRFLLSFLPRKDLLLSIGVGRSVQPLHLLTNSGVGLPRDLWVSSTSRIRPVDSWQLSGSTHWNPKPEWEVSLEGFYKYMANLVNFQEGLLTSIDATNWQNNVAVGEGWSYGMEWMIKKQGRRFSGWASYALTYSRRRFEEINLGESFPFQFDRRHSVNLVGILAITSKWTASAVWTFGSGTATTLPRSSYQFNQFNLLYSDIPLQFPFILDVSNYGRKNDIRLPAYHRLDLEVQYTSKRPRAEHQVSAGVYNLYNRFNPLFYILAERPDESGQYVPQYLELALLPVVPTLRYSLKLTVFPGKPPEK